MGADEGSANASSGVKPGALTALLEELAVAPDVQREPAWEPQLRPGDVVGRFELLRELGRGSFGVVWEARDQDLGRKVAFKLVRAGRKEAGTEQLHREAEVVARLQHPNLVTLHDVGRCEHGPYLVLELLRGETLQTRLAHGPLPLAEALTVAVEVARGLTHAHAQGVVHRDLKPSNVFLCERGGVKLLDFGMAHAFGRKRVSGGTPAYMAPEQWRDAPEDERTDVFALGVMLHQMLAGALPFPDDGGRSVREREPAPELQVPGAPALGPLVARMLAKDPAERTRDGGAALAELERISAESSRHRPVAAAAMAVPRPRHRRRKVTAAIAAAAAIALGAAALFLVRRPPASSAPPSVAVLPFADMSPQHDQEYFSDGIAEEILVALANVEGLRVPGRTSSFWFKGKGAKLAEIGRELNVRSVLEGSVRKDGNRVRVTAQLVNVGDGYHLWSETFDRELTDIFRIQDEISRAVAAALQVKLLAGAAGGGRGRPARIEAYEQYLLGRQLLNAGTAASIQGAREAFARAVALDEGYAPAHAGLARAYGEVAGLLTRTPEEVTQYARLQLASAERAVALDPALPDGYVARANHRLSYAWDWKGGLADIERAMSLGAGDSGANVEQALALAALGRFPEGLAAAHRSTEADPLWGWAWIVLARMLDSGGDQQGAEVAARRALQVSPDNPTAAYELGLALRGQGRLEEALACFDRNPLQFLRLTGLAITHHALGNARESQAALDELIARYSLVSAFQIAEVEAVRGEPDAAFAWLERARVQHDEGLEFVRMGSGFASLRSDPRWRAFLQKMNLPVD